jgi:hypothetical protein
MPYVDPADRDYKLPDPGYTAFSLADAINSWLRDTDHRLGARTIGVYVWGVCKLMNDYADRHPRCFDTWFDVMHALRIADLRIQHNPEQKAIVDCARLEFYRRVVAPYEDLKLAANGDVFSATLLVNQ